MPYKPTFNLDYFIKNNPHLFPYPNLINVPIKLGPPTMVPRPITLPTSPQQTEKKPEEQKILETEEQRKKALDFIRQQEAIRNILEETKGEEEEKSLPNLLKIVELFRKELSPGQTVGIQLPSKGVTLRQPERLPTEEEVKSLLQEAGVDPEAIKGEYDKRIKELEALRPKIEEAFQKRGKALERLSEVYIGIPPQVDISPLATLLSPENRIAFLQTYRRPELPDTLTKVAQNIIKEKAELDTSALAPRLQLEKEIGDILKEKQATPLSILKALTTATLTGGQIGTQRGAAEFKVARAHPPAAAFGGAIREKDLEKQINKIGEDIQKLDVNAAYERLARLHKEFKSFDPDDSRPIEFLGMWGAVKSALPESLGGNIARERMLADLQMIEEIYNKSGKAVTETERKAIRSLMGADAFFLHPKKAREFMRVVVEGLLSRMVMMTSGKHPKAVQGYIERDGEIFGKLTALLPKKDQERYLKTLNEIYKTGKK